MNNNFFVFGLYARIVRCIISEYHVVEVEFKDEECLIETLKEMGYKPEVFNEGTTITGYLASTKRKAHIVVRKSQFNGYGDLGFERSKDGYKLHVDDYDYGHSGKTDKIKMSRMKQVYAGRVIQKAIRRTSKFSFVSRKEVDGNIKIRVRRVGK